jgi:hypothetical protein
MCEAEDLLLATPLVAAIDCELALYQLSEPRRRPGAGFGGVGAARRERGGVGRLGLETVHLTRCRGVGVGLPFRKESCTAALDPTVEVRAPSHRPRSGHL